VLITVEDRFLNFAEEYIIMAGTTYISPSQKFNEIYIGVWWRNDRGEKRGRIYKLGPDDELRIGRDSHSNDLAIWNKKGNYYDLMEVKTSTVSRDHLAIIPGLDGIISIVDLRSKYGTHKLGEYTITGPNTLRPENINFEYTIDNLLPVLGKYMPTGEVERNNIVHGGEVGKVEPGKCVHVELATKAALFGEYVPGRGIVKGPAVGLLVCNLGYK